MSFLKNIFSGGNKDEQFENIGKVASDTALDLIKTLSGSHIKGKKKVIDNVVVFTNASGGTGASTILSNVAYTATKKGFRVIVIDLNIMYPVQHSYFGVRQAVDKPDLVSYLLGKTSLGESIESIGEASVLYANNRGLVEHINCESDAAVENFNLAITKLRQLFDLVLIDAPMSIENTLINSALYVANKIYLVWDESISSIANTERIRRNMATTGIDSYKKMDVILNKRTSIGYNKYPFQKLELEPLEIIPFDVEVINSGLKSDIFCDKGSSSSENANIFFHKIQELTDKVLRNGGYVE